MVSTLHVAISGVGRYGANLLNYLTENSGTLGIRVVGFVSRNPKILVTASAKLGISGYVSTKELFNSNRVDILFVATPDHLHYQDSLEGLQHGAHVFVQKPLTTNSEEAQDLCRVAMQRGLLLGVDFHKRFDPDIYCLHRMVKDGQLGKALYLAAHMEDRIEVPTEWLTWAGSSSPIWFLGTHLFDLVRFVTGCEIDRAFAVGGRHLLASRGIATLDYIQVLLESKNGPTASITCSWILPNAFEAIVRQGMTLTGTQGTMVIDSQDRGVRVAKGNKTETLNNHFMFRQAVGRRERSAGYAFVGIASFIEDVRSGESSMTGATGEDGLRATLIAAAVEESVAVGHPVPVSSPNLPLTVAVTPPKNFSS